MNNRCVVGPQSELSDFFSETRQNAIFVNSRESAAPNKQTSMPVTFKTKGDYISILKEKIKEILKITSINCDLQKNSI